MTLTEAQAIAARLWDTGKALRMNSPIRCGGRTSGRCIMGPTYPDGSFAAYYVGPDWASVTRRAMRNTPYDCAYGPRSEYGG